MKKCALLALVLCAFALPARATTFSTDVSDLWWNASESGWGLNVIHQGDILFLTFFVYGESNQATWYSGSETRYQSTLGNGSIVYSGPLHLTGGSWLGAPWNASAVNYRQVGNVTFTLTSVTTASLTYSVDGVSVSKQLTRLAWRINDLAGAYLGASLGTYTGCPAFSGYVEEATVFTVTQGTDTMTMRTDDGEGSTCTFLGNYSQAGRMGTSSGTFSCSTGFSGTFSAFEIEASLSAFTARAQITSGACRWNGRLGGMRRGP